VGIPSPDHLGFSDQMVFWDEAPVPGILGPMEIVADHPIVTHFEGIAVFLVTIDIYPAAVFF